MSSEAISLALTRISPKKSPPSSFRISTGVLTNDALCTSSDFWWCGGDGAGRGRAVGTDRDCGHTKTVRAEGQPTRQGPGMRADATVDGGRDAQPCQADQRRLSR